MSVEVWYPLLIDKGGAPDFEANDEFGAAPDWAGDRIYTYGPTFNPIYDHKIYAHDATTGEAVSTTLLSTACVISLNTFIAEPSLCVGLDHNLYALTSAGSSNIDQKANLRVSKINPATMTETGALVPASIGLDTFSNVYDFIMLPFQLNGVNYLVLALTGWCGHLEIINADTMTSVGTLLYTESCNTVNLVVGEQPNATTQNIYCIAKVSSGGSDIRLTRIVFDASGPSVSNSAVGTISGAQITASWTGHSLYPTALMFDPNDNGIVFFVLDDSNGQQRICKYLSGAVAWSTIVGTQNFNYFSMQYGMTASCSDLSSGALLFLNPRSAIYYTIDLATGASVGTASPHFDGFNGYSNASFGSLPSPFETGSSRLLYYYDGFNDQLPGWLSGWAVFGFDPDPPPPPPGLIVVPCPPPIMDDGPIVVYEPGCECP